MHSDLSKLRMLSISDWCTIGESKFHFIWIGTMLRVRGFADVRRWVETTRIKAVARGDKSHGRISPVANEHVARLVYLVGVASRRGPVTARCLVRSLALIRFLAKRGVAAQLRVGIQKPTSATLRAHAWVEIDGRSINDDPGIAKVFAAFPDDLLGTVVSDSRTCRFD